MSNILASRPAGSALPLLDAGVSANNLAPPIDATGDEYADHVLAIIWNALLQLTDDSQRVAHIQRHIGAETNMVAPSQSVRAACAVLAEWGMQLCARSSATSAPIVYVWTAGADLYTFCSKTGRDLVLTPPVDVSQAQLTDWLETIFGPDRRVVFL